MGAARIARRVIPRQMALIAALVRAVHTATPMLPLAVQCATGMCKVLEPQPVSRYPTPRHLPLLNPPRPPLWPPLPPQPP